MDGRRDKTRRISRCAHKKIPRPGMNQQRSLVPAQEVRRRKIGIKGALASLLDGHDFGLCRSAEWFQAVMILNDDVMMDSNTLQWWRIRQQNFVSCLMADPELSRDGWTMIDIEEWGLKK